MLVSQLMFDKSMEEFENIVKNSIYDYISTVEITGYLSKEPLSFSNKETGEKVSLNIGDIWGNRYDCAWFHIDADLKDINTDNLYLIIDMSGEGCVFTKEGVPYRGLTTRCALYEQWIGKHHKKVCELNPFIENGKLSIWIDCGANDMLGSCYNNGIIKEAYIGRKNQEFYKLNYDIDVLLDLSKQLYKDDPRKAQIEHCLYEASKCIPTGAQIRSGVNYIGSPDKTKEIKKGKTEDAIKAIKILEKVFNKKAGDTPITHHMVGHSHIDLAWLWPIRETKRKCQRTFATVLRNMEKYPEYKFVQSQAQAYNWIKEEHPALFEEIKSRVKEGRWEVNGGMWVEADGNVASGESFARQFLYGKEFFKKEFGVDCKVCHLPDTFGYNGALPQIIKESEMDYFLFQKLMINMHNKFPYNSFIWQGIDGSEILCHMPPCNTYQSNALPECNLRAERNYAEKGVSEHVLSLYGIGDGGSGPGEEHLERIKRQKDLYGVGKNIMSSSIDFFKCLEKEKENLNTWIGEMYLEYHQGTLTTQAKNKWYNRHLEFALRNAEIICSFAKIYKNIPYPKDELKSIWKKVLLYQFHDILPGSSIKRVYDESIASYKELYEETNNIIKNTLEKAQFGSFINTLSFDREDYVKIDNTWKKISTPALGISNKFENINEICIINQNTIENSLIKISWTKEGFINVFDKETEKYIFKSPSNRLTIFNDTIDAWDMYGDYGDRGFEFAELINIKTYSEGSIGIAELSYKYNNSTINQKVIVKPNTKLVEFDTSVDWHESCKMLRVSFDTNINTDFSRSDIQFGNIKRSTKDYTKFDKAKYEICANKWIDISEKYYGFALLNDSKYGHYAKEGLISLNLLRGTSYPDEEADQGLHNFRYGILPHKGDYIDGKVIEEAYIFNCPIYISKGNTYNSLINVPNHLIVETIKEAEENNNIIVRLYEAKEVSEKSTIKFNFPIKKVYRTNILEHIQEELPINGNSITIDTKPFKIYTLMIEQ